MITEVYDIETLINLFTYTGFCRQDNTYYQFVIHKDRNDLELLYKHLLRSKLMIQVGFNNELFDYPVIHYLISNFEKLKLLSGYEVANTLYLEAQRIIHSTEYTAIWDNNKYIPQIDLFKIWHYNNKARSTSLKDLEFAMNMENIEEMPFDHTHYCSFEDIDQILSYNKNDVFATNLFLDSTLGNTEYSLYKGKNKLQLRFDLKKEYGLNCINFNDVKIGEKLLLKLYCKKLNLEEKVVEKLRTFRPVIYTKDCIPNWAFFKNKCFNKGLINKFENTIVKDGILKDVLDFSVIYHGIRIDYGAGGAHACIKSGIYKEDDYWTIIDLDIDGMYPSCEITQGIYPEHLGPEFIKILDDEIVSVRKVEKKKPKKERRFTIVEGFKLAANGSYGKSNAKESFLYDPLYTLKTTIPGQIAISMWTELICEAVPESIILQINTDGITLKVPRHKVDEVLKQSDKLTEITGLTYEVAFYKQMVIRDVNNYLAEYQDNTSNEEHIKLKGCFEIDKEYHKDNSMKIVPIALKNYFIYNIPIEDTIKNHNNIYDFCLRLKVNSLSKAFLTTLNLQDNKLIKKSLHRTTRYYISNHGGALSIYYNNSDEPNRINVGYLATIFNKYYSCNNYDINYDFYIIEANKIKNSIEDNQLNLF